MHFYCIELPTIEGILFFANFFQKVKIIIDGTIKFTIICTNNVITIINLNYKNAICSNDCVGIPHLMSHTWILQSSENKIS